MDTTIFLCPFNEKSHKCLWNWRLQAITRGDLGEGPSGEGVGRNWGSRACATESELLEETEELTSVVTSRELLCCSPADPSQISMSHRIHPPALPLFSFICSTEALGAQPALGRGSTFPVPCWQRRGVWAAKRRTCVCRLSSSLPYHCQEAERKGWCANCDQELED